LGLEESSENFKEVRWKELPEAIDVYYVDPQAVFQKYVSEKLKPEYYEKLKSNGIYKQISKNLRETHNFAALYQMEQILSDNQYDLIVLDTPPCHQVVDFFEAPKRLQKFFSAGPVTEKKGWLHWVQEKGVQVVEGFLKTLVGPEFVQEMDGFFKAVSDLKKEIHGTSEKFLESFSKPGSELILVFPPAEDKIEDANYLLEEMEKNNYQVSGFVLNRAYPKGLDFSKEVSLPADSREKKLYNYYKEQRTKSEQILRSFLEKPMSENTFFVSIPELSGAIESLEDVYGFSMEIGENWNELGE